MQQLESLLSAAASLRKKYDTDNPHNKDLKIEILAEFVAECIKVGGIPKYFEVCTSYTNQIFEVTLELFDMLEDLNIEIGAVFDFKDQTSSTIVFSLFY